jgi:hypothetical protein
MLQSISPSLHPILLNLVPIRLDALSKPQNRFITLVEAEVVSGVLINKVDFDTLFICLRSVPELHMEITPSVFKHCLIICHIHRLHWVSLSILTAWLSALQRIVGDGTPACHSLLLPGIFGQALPSFYLLADVPLLALRFEDADGTLRGVHRVFEIEDASVAKSLILGHFVVVDLSISVSKLLFKTFLYVSYRITFDKSESCQD